MSSSVADEILKLHGLMQQGILSLEEFQSAKQAVILRATSGIPAPVPSAAAAPQQQQQARAASNSAIDTLLFEESHTGAHAKAYNHLRRIVQNILRSPGDPRVRRLRAENPTLQGELFSDPGAEPFLRSIGFAFEAVPLPDGRTDDVMVLHSPAVDLQAALAALDELELRDAAAAGAAVALGKLRRSVGMEVRSEKWAAAKACGELEQFIRGDFLTDTAGDVLFSALENADALAVVTANLLAAPGEAKFRRLKLSNRRVRRAIFDQSGGLEYLVGMLGFEVRPDCVTLPSTGTDDAQAARLVAGQQFLAGLKEAIAQRRSEIIAQQRKAASQAALDEMALARKEAAKKQQKQTTSAAAAGGEGGAPAASSFGRRVPLQEALQQLLGRNIDGGTQQPPQFS